VTRGGSPEALLVRRSAVSDGDEARERGEGGEGTSRNSRLRGWIGTRANRITRYIRVRASSAAVPALGTCRSILAPADLTA